MWTFLRLTSPNKKKATLMFFSLYRSRWRYWIMFSLSLSSLDNISSMTCRNLHTSNIVDCYYVIFFSHSVLHLSSFGYSYSGGKLFFDVGTNDESATTYLWNFKKTMMRVGEHCGLFDYIKVNVCYWSIKVL